MKKVSSFLTYVGVDPKREGDRNTPQRRKKLKKFKRELLRGIQCPIFKIGL